MLKTALLASAAAIGLSVAAQAADLPSRAAPAPYLALPTFTWTGFYVGANAGYIFSDTGRVTTVGNNGPVGGPSTIFNVNTGARPPLAQVDPEGFIGGGQVGYNIQIGSFVGGIEADAAYTDYRRTVGVLGTSNALSSFTNDLGFLGTVRARAGYTFGQVLLYGTGGLAYGDVRQNATFFATPAAGGTGVVQFAGGRTSIEIGYAAGAGVEYALPTSFSVFGSSAVTIRAEALYYDLGRRNVIVADTGLAPAATRGQSYTSRFDTDGVIARAGINFKFGSF